MTESNQGADNRPRTTAEGWGQPTDSTTPEQAKEVASHAGDRASAVAETAKSEAAALKDTTADAASHVVETAKQEASTVVSEAKYQTRRLVDEGMSELRTQSAAGQQRLAGFVRSLSGELQSMSEGTNESGPMVDLVNRVQRFGNDTADWLERNEPDQVVASVRSFAARKPFTFLAISAGVGFVGARLLRGLQSANSDDKEARAALQRPVARAPQTDSQFRAATPEFSDQPYDARLASSATQQGMVDEAYAADGSGRRHLQTEYTDEQFAPGAQQRTDPWGQGLR